MAKIELSIPFIPSSKKQPPPTKLRLQEDGKDIYLWYITEDEYLRLSKIFGRDFQEAGLGGTLVEGLPSPCTGCGKYTEFIDWVWTAIQRGVHSKEFMFKALQDSRQGMENSHDVYCSECGTLTVARSINNAEGGAPNISLAGRLNRSNYSTVSSAVRKEKVLASSKVPTVVWGRWWLDDNGSTARYRESLKAAGTQTDSK